MPRRTRREDPEGQRRRGASRGPRRIEDAVGPQWAQVDGFVVVSSSADREYICPYCNRRVSGGSHIVAYPVGDLSGRRHYHPACWAKQHRLTR